MTPDQIKPGMRYIVTKPSKNKEFQAGDHVWLGDDGALCCVEAQGWIAAEDVAEATEGAEFAIDADYTAKRRAALEAELASLIHPT